MFDCGSGGGVEMPKRLFRELSRRRVFRGGGTYVVVAWLVLQMIGAAAGPEDPIRRLAVLMAFGLFPLAVVFSWVFKVIPGVVEREDHGEAPPPSTRQGRVLDIAVAAGLALIAVIEITRVVATG